MNIKQYLDSTYLKTASQAGLTEAENHAVAEHFIREAIQEQFKLVMIRPEMVATARKMVDAAQSKVLVGTVIDFPNGSATIEEKLSEARKVMIDGADELDFVCNYEAFKNGDSGLVKDEVLKGTQLALDHLKSVKWIIEVAALNNRQIVQLSALIKNIVLGHFKEDFYERVFVKSSTGFYQTNNDLPNGATTDAVIMMLENASPLPVKAAGGVRTYAEAEAMIALGVKRIGTSSAKAIAHGDVAQNNY